MTPLSGNENSLRVPTIIVTSAMGVLLAVGAFMFRSVWDELHETRLAIVRLTVDSATMQQDVKRMESALEQKGVRIELMSDNISSLTLAVEDLKTRRQK